MGKKPNILTDSIGLLLAVAMTTASVQDQLTGVLLPEHTATAHLHEVWVDGGYRQRPSSAAPNDPAVRGFTVLPHR